MSIITGVIIPTIDISITCGTTIWNTCKSYTKLRKESKKRKITTFEKVKFVGVTATSTTGSAYRVKGRISIIRDFYNSSKKVVKVASRLTCAVSGHLC